MSNLVSEDLFEKLRGRFSNLTLGREDGVETLRPQEATFFEFDYKHKGKELGSVVISLVDEGALKVYFSTHMLDEVEQNARKDWYIFLKDMSRFASRNMLNYEAKNITKERLDKKDYLFLTNRNKSEEELAMESKLYGSKQKSYQNLNGAKIIVQHTNTVDEEKMGSRGRNIKAIYIENSQGERFRFENNYLPGARAMAMHISNGGWPNDDHGKHIGEIMKEMTDLKHFVRAVKRDDYIAEAAQKIIETARNHYNELKNTLQSISRQRGYTNYLENFVPSITEVDENDVNDIKQQLTREVFDDRLNDSLTAVSRAIKLNEKKKGMFHDYDTWLRSAKSVGAEVEGDVRSSKAIRHRKEIGHWTQDAEDLEGTKVASGIEKPGYGEIGLDTGDRAETSEREFELPQSLELAPGDDTITGMKFADKSALITAILLDIADRARDDEVSIFAGNIADKISSVGIPFGQEADDPDFTSNMKKAIALSNMYVKQIKNESVEEKSNTTNTEETDPNTDNDMFKAYESQMNLIAEGTWTIPDKLSTVSKLQELVSQHFAVGIDAENVTSALYDIIGDDSLFDALGLAFDEEGPDVDARPIIKDWLEKFISQMVRQSRLDPEVITALKNIDYGDMAAEEPEEDIPAYESEHNESIPEEEIAADRHRGAPVNRHSNAAVEATEIDARESDDEEVVDKLAEEDAYKDQVLYIGTHYEGRSGGKTWVAKMRAKDLVRLSESDDPGYDFADNADEYPFKGNNKAISGAIAWISSGEFKGAVHEALKSGYAEYEDEETVHVLTKSAKEAKTKVLELWHRSDDYGDGDEEQRAAAVLRTWDDEEAGENESIEHLKKMAGIGSGARSNHGIYEGEQGYQITPRSIVARQMRKLQDIAKLDKLESA